MPPRESPSSAKPKSTENLREKVFLASLAAEGGLKVVPGKRWALHYPKESSVRNERLAGLLEGRYTPQQAAPDLRPDAVIYNVDDLAEGLESVSSRVRDLSAQVQYYDYERFADFVASMHGRDVNIETVQFMYDGIAGSRIRKKLLDAYGHTGREQMQEAMQIDAKITAHGMTHLPRAEKILGALKINWMCEDLRFVSTDERTAVLAKLSKDERKVFDALKGPYREYAQTGSIEQYRKLTTAVKEALPELQKPDMSESMQELKKELDPLKKKVGPPGSEKDPAISREDKDEYHTPPPRPKGAKESGEKMKARTIFEIEPSGTSRKALTGSYCSGRKSYFDIDRKTWSKKKRLTPYNKTLVGQERQTISGFLYKKEGIISLPLPNHYALDAASLRAQSQVKISRDQNGCFYLETDRDTEFSIDFLREEPGFSGHVIPEDTQPIHRGSLSPKTEAMIQSLSGNAEQKAEQARIYLLSNHFYPGGGDLDDAQALQYKLREESNGNNYIQNLDASEYLECYSANTLFIAMVRKAGIPARLVVGHKVEGAKNGKAVITESTGHAWAEIWDGAAWRRFDATPPPKPEDKKKKDKDKDEEGEPSPSEEADDGGIEQETPAPSGESPEEDLPGDVKKKVQQKLDDMKEAKDQEMEQGESDMEKAEEKLEDMEKKQQEMSEKVQEAKKFQDLKKLEEELKREDLLDDMKKELEEKLDGKEEEMKEKIKEELEKMAEDGFIDEEKRDELERQLEEGNRDSLDQLQHEIDRESRLYDAYDAIREEVRPLVERWFKYFVDRLPREKAVEVDEDSLTRQGAFNRHSVMKPRNLIFGTVKNPRVIRSSVKPLFLAKMLVDVSGSMQGVKLHNARKMLIFYSELFSRISERFGYIRFAIDIFSDSIKEIMRFGDKYNASTRYDFRDGTPSSTIKVRLMNEVATAGGTNMLDAIQKSARDLNEEKREYTDYASALYFMGDGEDTCGNAANIRRFLQTNNAESGFGEHMLRATLLGDESQKRELADIFGEDHTTVAPDFEELVEQSMVGFDEDIMFYMKGKFQS